jgi:hypothetical protein
MAKSDDKQRDVEQHTGRPAPEHARVARGPSPLDEQDQAALEGGKSESQERNAPAAGDPATRAELDGLSLLGGSDPRGDGAIAGVSDPVRDGSGGPRERAGEEIQVAGGGGRQNPPLMEDAGMGDGGISVSGGVAGGSRGHGGTSDSGAGGPMGDTSGGRPASFDAASRFDLDAPTTDVGDDDGDGRDR